MKKEEIGNKIGAEREDVDKAAVRRLGGLASAGLRGWPGGMTREVLWGAREGVQPLLRDADAGEGARWAVAGTGCRHRRWSQSPGTVQPLTVLQRPRPPRTALGRPHETHRQGSRWRHAPENRARPGDPGVDSVGGPWGSWGWSSVVAGVKGQGGQGRGQAGSSSCSLHTNPPDHSGDTALVPPAWRPQAPPHVSPGL